MCSPPSTKASPNRRSAQWLGHASRRAMTGRTRTDPLSTRFCGSPPCVRMSAAGGWLTPPTMSSRASRVGCESCTAPGWPGRRAQSISSSTSSSTPRRRRARLRRRSPRRWRRSGSGAPQRSRRMTSSERRPRKRPKRARRRCVLRLWRQRSVRQRSATRCRRRVALAQRHQRSATSAHSHSGAPTTRVRYIPPRHGRLGPGLAPDASAVQKGARTRGGGDDGAAARAHPVAKDGLGGEAERHCAQTVIASSSFLPALAGQSSAVAILLCVVCSSLSLLRRRPARCCRATPAAPPRRLGELLSRPLREGCPVSWKRPRHSLPPPPRQRCPPPFRVQALRGCAPLEEEPERGWRSAARAACRRASVPLLRIRCYEADPAVSPAQLWLRRAPPRVPRATDSSGMRLRTGLGPAPGGSLKRLGRSLSVARLRG
mmetsp:Transcript_15483/g.44437  ORF Transcript_15483/g.44437 Transcript_15483/m.44437 type:complete len:430 (+) Transcript_15483:95-1384(+)